MIRETETCIKQRLLLYFFSQINSIVKGKPISQGSDVVIRELLTDTRKVIFPESSLFFALEGTRRNGHAFIGEAYKKGIRNFIVSDADPALSFQDCSIIQVKNVLEALQSIAAYHRSQFYIPVVGITGSNGKTIVKEWLNQLLHDRYRIVRSPKSYNSQIGVPLSIWQMDGSASLGLFEAGISQVGEMEKLQAIIQPTIGIFTNIGDAHASGFLNAAQKINEKLLLFSNVETLVYCSDYEELDTRVKAMKANRSASLQLISWSRMAGATLRVTKIIKNEIDTTITGEYDSQTSSITIPFTDEAAIENAISCWCLLLFFQLPAGEISTKMLTLEPVAMRLELKEGINNSSIINDSYSADLSSLKIALQFLQQQYQHPKRTVILADFPENGNNEKELYAGIANLLKEHKVDRLIGIGPVISRNQFAFRLSDHRFFSSVGDFRQQLSRTSFSNETILIKGARAFALEQINGLLENQTHQTVLEIDLSALLHNLSTYQHLLQPATKLMAMVKAFSYGTGSYEIASVLQRNNVDYLAVAYADEGVELRKGGITLPVMVMNPDESSFDTLVNYNLEPEMYSSGLILAFERFLKKEGLVQYPVHIELETGMNRLGFAGRDMDALLQLLQTNTFHVQSVFSHLVASEDAAMDQFTHEQAASFNRMSDQIRHALSYPFLKHLLNTSGISRFPTLHYDMVRIGIGLYGIDSARGAELTEVSTLRSAIAQIKHLQSGESIGYGRAGMVYRPSRIATVRLGYADGYPRSLGNGHGKMLVNGSPAPTIGHICMDMTMIDITDIPGVNDGDPVIVFGKGLPVSELAAAAGTISYEILTGVSQRVKRVYYQD